MTDIRWEAPGRKHHETTIPDDPSEPLTIKQVALLAGVSAGTVLKKVTYGALAAEKGYVNARTTWLIDRQDADEYAAEVAEARAGGKFRPRW